jgi:hypothetical protein
LLKIFRKKDGKPRRLALYRGLLAEHGFTLAGERGTSRYFRWRNSDRSGGQEKREPA